MLIQMQQRTQLREGLSRLACPERGAALTGHREPVLSDLSRKQEIRSRLVARDAQHLVVSEAGNPRLLAGRMSTIGSYGSK
jgi:hypothetical protein